MFIAAPMTRPKLCATKLVMTHMFKNMKKRIASIGWSDMKYTMTTYTVGKII